MGEACVRGNVSHGDGVYKSTDAGQDLEATSASQDSATSARSACTRKNPDIVYVAALGHLCGPNAERGVYRSTDGGATWKQVLFVRRRRRARSISRWTRRNPRVLYAAFWQVVPQALAARSAAAPGSGLFKIDRRRRHLDARSRASRACRRACWAASASPSRRRIRERVWALVEAEDGGRLPLATTRGATWTRVNERPQLRQRAWYYIAHLSPTRRTPTPSTCSTSACYRVDRRRPHLHADRAAARRQSRPLDRARRSAAHDRGQRRRRRRQHRRRPHLVHAS